MSATLRRLKAAARRKLKERECYSGDDDVGEVIAMAYAIGAREDGSLPLWEAAARYASGERASRTPETRGYCEECRRDNYGTPRCPICNRKWKLARYVDAVNPADSARRKGIETGEIGKTERNASAASRAALEKLRAAGVSI